MTKDEYIKMNNLHDKHWWFRGKKDIISYILKHHKYNIVSLLDIGCGSGYFFSEYSGMGVEPCNLFRGRNIINDKIENVNIEGKFDAIICLDVLEHLNDDTVIKKIIDNNLNENGIVIITVPANKKLFNNHDIVNGHYRRYDKQDLLYLLNEYSPEIYYYNSILYPIEYVIRKTSKGVDNLKVFNKYINEILYNIIRLEKFIFRYS